MSVFVAVAFLLCGSALAAPPQHPDPQAAPLRRAVLPVGAARAQSAGRDPTEVVFRLVGAPMAAPKDWRSSPELRDVLADRPVTSLFVDCEPALQQLRSRLARLPASTRPQVDLGTWFVARARDVADGMALRAALDALPAVEIAYFRNRLTNVPGVRRAMRRQPPTPDLTSLQDYRGPAPLGVEAVAGESLSGGWGRGVRLLDIEDSWIFGHEDVTKLTPSALMGAPSLGPMFPVHGLEVCGILAADPNDFGITGIAPDIDLRLASSDNIAAAIVAGLPLLGVGDVILIEAVVITSRGEGPAEWDPAIFDAILTATSLGVTVVEPAGNNGADLDGPNFEGAFDRSVRDSGAILVGAAHDGWRAIFSSFGSRIDCHAHGFFLVTAGGGDLYTGTSKSALYTANFGGTSGSSAIVAGLAAAILGAAKAQLDPATAATFDGLRVRQLLSTIGTAIRPQQQIGLQPDLGRIFDAAGLRRGLEIVGEPRLRKSVRFDLPHPTTPTPGDLWAIGLSLAPANLALPAPFAPGARLLLDPATLTWLGLGTLGIGTAPSLGLAIPPSPTLAGLRAQVQGFWWLGDGSLTTTSAAHLFVRS